MGFDRSLLKRQTETQDNHDDAAAELVKCIYDDGAKRAALADLGRAAASAFTALRSAGEAVPPSFRTQHSNPTEDYIKTSYYLLKSLTTVTPLYYKSAAQFKHQGFAEEHEWRIVYHSFHKSLIPSLKSRTGQFGLTPYVEFPLGLRKPASNPLKRIVVGPSTHIGLGAHQQDIKNSVELLLRKHGIDGVDVAISLVPYGSA